MAGPVQSVGDRMPNWELAPDGELWAFSDPGLSNPSQDAKEVLLSYLPYLPPPPLGQDMTQGQFLSGV